MSVNGRLAVYFWITWRMSQGHCSSGRTLLHSPVIDTSGIIVNEGHSLQGREVSKIANRVIHIHHGIFEKLMAVQVLLRNLGLLKGGHLDEALPKFPFFED